MTWTDGLTVLPGDDASYLRSFAWRALRDRVLERDGGRCVYCEEPAVEVHHESYSRVGREELDDLSAVCRACHLRVSFEASSKTVGHRCSCGEERFERPE